MKCPKCAAGSRVLSTRENKHGHIDRRHVCFGPEKHRFTTSEVTVDELGVLRASAFRLERICLLIKEKL